MKVIFLGAGAWGTAMAMHASKNLKNFDVTLWSRSSSLADEMTKTHRNQKYLPNIDLPLQLKIDRKSTRLNSSHIPLSRMPSSA